MGNEMQKDEIVTKLASGVQELRTRYESAMEENSTLLQRVEALEKRAMAEEILLGARKQANVPAKFRAASIEDFLEKRAALENSSLDHINKIASMIEYMGDGGVDDLTLEDNENASTAGVRADVLNDWLRSISG